jgi:FlaA1/EpsC-like NDP-sugar epimerase
MRNNDKKIKPHKYPVSRIVAVLAVDILTSLLASFLSISIRFDFGPVMAPFWEHYLKNIPMILCVTILCYIALRLYRSIWRYASANELIRIIVATFLAAAVIFLISTRVTGYRMPRSYYAFYWAITAIFTSAVRFSYRAFHIIADNFTEGARAKRKNVMVIGAGAAGNLILREIESSAYLNMKVKCIIDDNELTHGRTLRGVPIVGGRRDIGRMAKAYAIDEIIFAIPSANMQVRREILSICNDTGCMLKAMPGMYQLINGDVSVAKLKEVDIEDLLGREPVRINTEEVLNMHRGKVVLVTGGGGSIGSELCRQIAGHEPKQLIIVDIYENNAYDIQQELRMRYPELNLVVLIASVRNEARMDKIFETYRPEIVYHAAAHKHVPLMEDSPNEAIKNNVEGTLKTAKAADKYGTERFVLISTDKAVNPTNVMGASKRICEMIIQHINAHSKTNFVAVRFGNVLGSNGSVIPLFKKQILEGGPVTVTDPEIIRYFMSIPEAVSLVLQAGAYAKGGEIFVLDMGYPIKIADLAKNLIRLSGYKVDEDIKIVYTGLRPGEKMYEELLMDEEGLRKTENHLIFIGKPIEFDDATFEERLQRISADAENEMADIRPVIKELVPTYHYGE